MSFPRKRESRLSQPSTAEALRIPACAQGCPEKGLRLGSGSVRRFGLLSTPRRHAARSPSTRHGASKVRATRCLPARRHGGCFACAPPLRVTAIARRGYWRPRRFAAETGRSAVSVSKTAWWQKGHRGGRGSRLAKRSGATGRLGLDARSPRWRRSVWDLLSRARSLLSLARQKPANKLDIALLRDGRAPGVKFALTFPGQPCACAGMN